jgi:hypothetical protein
MPPAIQHFGRKTKPEYTCFHPTRFLINLQSESDLFFIKKSENPLRVKNVLRVLVPSCLKAIADNSNQAQQFKIKMESIIFLLFNLNIQNKKLKI